MRASASYLIWCASGLICTLMLCGSFAVLVDPYYVFGITVTGVNELHPRANDQMIAARVHLASRLRPRTLLLGNSRIEAGFDPASPAWPRSMTPVFDGGLPGMGLEAAQRVVEAAMAGGRLKHILVAVEFFDAIDAAGHTASPIRTDVRPPTRWLERAQDWFDASLTIGAFADSIQTVLSQGSTAINVTRPDGSAELGKYAVYVRRQGGASLFEHKLAEYRTRFASYSPPEFDQPQKNATLTALIALLNAAHANHSDVAIIIYPYHAATLDLLRQHGLWSGFEQFKRLLVDVVWQRYPNTRIVDFSGYNVFTTEPPPPPGPGHAMRWYWEPGHFRTALGDRIIDRLYGDRGDFGRDLTPATVEAVLAAIRHERDEALAQAYSPR
jgi:hypothetical protein